MIAIPNNFNTNIFSLLKYLNSTIKDTIGIKIADEGLIITEENKKKINKKPFRMFICLFRLISIERTTKHALIKSVKNNVEACIK